MVSDVLAWLWALWQHGAEICVLIDNDVWGEWPSWNKVVPLGRRTLNQGTFEQFSIVLFICSKVFICSVKPFFSLSIIFFYLLAFTNVILNPNSLIRKTTSVIWLQICCCTSVVSVFFYLLTFLYHKRKTYTYPII